MVTYWCSWCGSTARRPTANAAVPCARCVAESLRIFGFWPRALMTPLNPRERPPPPTGARRRFTFRDVRSGEVRHRTDPIGPVKLRPVPL